MTRGGPERRAVSILTVADPSALAEMERVVPLASHLGERVGQEWGGAEGWVVSPAFEREIVPLLRQQGISVLVRYARRASASFPSDDLGPRLEHLAPRARAVLHTAQRHAIEGMVVGAHAWDPETDAAQVRELLSTGLLEQLDLEGGLAGRMALHPDLPPPPEIPYDFTEAAMPEPTDLGQARPGPLGLLHDLASLAAVIDQVGPKRTLAGAIAAVDGRRLHERLCTGSSRPLEDHERWGRALRGLEALGAVSLDPTTRALTLDRGLERTLSGSTEQALDRLVHRLVEADLHSALPAVRAALCCARDGAVDEVIFHDLLFEQHREVLFTPWRRGAVPTYPAWHEDRPFDREGFDAVEGPMLRRLVRTLERLGVVRTAQGVFAATADGRRWASVEGQPLPPVWVSSDLELVVPPDGLTPWERFQVERFSRALARDVVDRYRLERAGVESWLRHHEIDEAIALLQRRCPAVPDNVLQTLQGWASAAGRVTITRGVLLP